MKLRALCLLVCVLVATSVLAGGSRASGDKEPLAVELSLASDEIMTGEALVLNYRFVTESPMRIDFAPGQYYNEWLKVEVVDASGRATPFIADHRPPPYGDSSSPGMVVKEGQPQEGQLVLSQWVSLTRPGQYRVRVRVKLPYDAFPEKALQEAEDGAAAEDTAKLRVSKVLTFEQTMPLRVTPLDRVRLEAKAEDLRKAAVQERNVARRNASVESLFSMPEAVVRHAWRKLLNDPASGYVRSEVVSQLVRLGTPAAADILLEVSTNNALPQATRKAAVTGTWDMYRGNAPGIRPYLERLHKARYGAPSDMFAQIRSEEKSAAESAARIKRLQQSGGRNR